MKTLCEFCIFNKKTDGIQTGCELNRLDKFKSEKVNNHHVIDGYCATCRNVYWEHASLTLDKKKEKVYEECKITYDVISITEKIVVEDIIKFKDSILALDFKPKKVFILCEFSTDNAYSLLEVSKKCPANFEFIMSKEDTNAKKIYSMFGKVSGNYLCFCELSSKIDDKIIHAFNEASIIDCKPKTLFFGEEFCFVATILYKHVMFYETPFGELIKYVTSDNINNSEL